MPRKKTTEEFIADAGKVHGDKYGYPNAKYINDKTKVEIVCPIHGEFWQTPHGHLLGRGCPKCKNVAIGNRTRSDTEAFITKSTKLHKNKYDYSLVKYLNAKTKVKIICPIKGHGIFEQTPGQHLNRAGCPKCGIIKRANSARHTLKDFKSKAIKIHKNKYDYSSAEYLNNRTKIKIICPIENHGAFVQTPASHLRGAGCPVCGRESRAKPQTKTIDEFIGEATKLHKNKYDYSLVKYLNAKTKVKIICPVKGHGMFEQTPGSHLRGAGCPVCAGNIKLRTEDFIERAVAVHGNRYNYSLAEYTNGKNKVKIICPVENHGIYSQKAEAHLSGSGCPKCSTIVGASKIKLSLEAFKSRAIKIHEDRYDYSLVKYLNSKTKIKIICPIEGHGVFEQTPGSHLSGNGCPTCSESRGEKVCKQWFLNNKIKFESQFKVKKLKNIGLYGVAHKEKSYDFFIPENKLLLELDGSQHFKIGSFGSKDDVKIMQNFIRIQESDKIKNDIAKMGGYSLIRIPYWEMANIEDILTKLFAKKGLNQDILKRYSYHNNMSFYHKQVKDGKIIKFSIDESTHKDLQNDTDLPVSEYIQEIIHSHIQEVSKK